MNLGLALARGSISDLNVEAKQIGGLPSSLDVFLKVFRFAKDPCSLGSPLRRRMATS